MMMLPWNSVSLILLPCAVISLNIKPLMAFNYTWGLEKVGFFDVALPNSETWPESYPRDKKDLLIPGTEYYLPNARPDVNINFDLNASYPVQGVFVKAWFDTYITQVQVGVHSNDGYTGQQPSVGNIYIPPLTSPGWQWFSGQGVHGNNECCNKEQTIFIPKISARYVQIQIRGGYTSRGYWGLRQVQISQATTNAEVQGDPHFKTFHGDHFSYHGECDLVLMKNNHFSDGLGILIHVRTKIEKTWSYVKNAAVKIGNDILEIEGRGQVWDKSADAVHIVNGEVNADLPLLFATKFPVTRMKEKQCDTKGAKCIEAIVYKIDLGDGDNILITQKWGVIKVSVTAIDKNKFHDSVGLMGHFDKPGFLARDGVHKMTNFNEFGQEWQVLQSEPMIFNERRAPQHPEQCTLPIVTTKRRLREDSALHEMAEEACTGVEEASRVFCVYDVIAAGTAEAASTYYTAYAG